jgi:Regulator of G protein signaling domain
MSDICPRVTSLDQVLADKELSVAFRAFLHRQYCAENFSFWLDASLFESGDQFAAVEAKRERARQLEALYFADDSPSQVNVSASVYAQVAGFQLDGATEQQLDSVFSAARAEIQALLVSDTLPRFCQSTEYADYLASLSSRAQQKKKVRRRKRFRAAFQRANNAESGSSTAATSSSFELADKYGSLERRDTLHTLDRYFSSQRRDAVALPPHGDDELGSGALPVLDEDDDGGASVAGEGHRVDASSVSVSSSFDSVSVGDGIDFAAFPPGQAYNAPMGFLEFIAADGDDHTPVVREVYLGGGRESGDDDDGGDISADGDDDDDDEGDGDETGDDGGDDNDDDKSGGNGDESGVNESMPATRQHQLRQRAEVRIGARRRQHQQATTAYGGGAQHAAGVPHGFLEALGEREPKSDPTVLDLMRRLAEHEFEIDNRLVHHERRARCVLNDYLAKADALMEKHERMSRKRDQLQRRLEALQRFWSLAATRQALLSLAHRHFPSTSSLALGADLARAIRDAQGSRRSLDADKQQQLAAMIERVDVIAPSQPCTTIVPSHLHRFMSVSI